MTVVNHETGEILEFDTAAAERRAERITLRLDAIAENYARVLPLIREAIEKRDDIALGYRSPGEYVSDRFGQSLAGLGVEVRRAVVGELTEAGLSTRAIAPVVGTSHMTVKADRDAGVKPFTPAPQAPPAVLPETKGQGVDQHKATGEDSPTVGESMTQDGEDFGNPRPAITGIDGKTYTPPKPRLAPVANSAEWDDQDRAEELASNLARNLSLTYALTNADRRAEYIANWSRGIKDRPVLGHNFVTPKHMRAIADALRTFATEWEQANV